ncbi:MAG: hypothetical protein ACI8P0_002065, partial [Planctomycetaceae bacterium]
MFDRSDTLISRAISARIGNIILTGNSSISMKVLIGVVSLAVAACFDGQKIATAQ